ncbi:MAG: hypothetical protein HC844_08455 [Tabrizicola sp.]|nr:hypothetical protein [Tabrizicola sp.]
MAEDQKRPPVVNSPVVLVPLLIGVGALFATILWFSARREAAAIYGIIRSVELPFLSQFMPYAQHFTLESLRTGTVPAFSMIYANALVYGLTFTALIFVLMMLALNRLDRHSIMDQVTIKSDNGRSPEEVMRKLAVVEPSVRFFLDYDIMSLPTTEGTARQPMRAIELLLYTDAIRAVEVDPTHERLPDLDVDRDRLAPWLSDRFGPINPFMQDGAKRRLLDKREIERAVDALSWYSVLVLYPALLRIHAFYVEDKNGYETTQNTISNFIDGIWDELNGFKKEFGPAISLGYASEADREERNALYRAQRATGGAKKGRKGKKGKPLATETESLGIEGSTILDNMTDLARVYRRGRMDRGEIPSDGTVARDSAGSSPRDKKAPPPQNLLFFGEVLSERGPGLMSVATAREGLKDVLTRHLGSQRKLYPVGTDPKTGLVVYDKQINTTEQKAFNTKAQERLATAERTLEDVLFRHQFEFTVVGGALDRARKYGIMPPNLFRWLRFCDETVPFWWFIQNLGMPAAYPENAAHYEHYQVEKIIGVAIERPHVSTCIDGIRLEAIRYLVPERIEELRAILGRDAIIRRMVGRGRAEPMPGVTGQSFDSIVSDIEQGNLLSATAAPPPAAPAARAPQNRILPRSSAANASAHAEQPGVATRESILSAFDLDDDD